MPLGGDGRVVVFESVENEARDRCVDFFHRPDGSFGFSEFRRDAEDQGRWTPVHVFADASFPSEQEMRRQAVATIGWLSSKD